MASYSIAAAERAAYGKTLVAATVDTVTFTSSDRNTVKVTNDDGGAAIHFTVDGTAPTSGGAATYRLPAVAGASLSVEPRTGGATVVKLISTGTPTYSVEGD